MKGNELLFKLWLAPRWWHYAITLIAVIGCTVLRILLTPWIGDKIQLLWFSIPIGIACFIGGFWPGMLAISMSMTIGIRMFVLGSESWANDRMTSYVTIGSFAAIWLFICFVCDIMRNAAISYREASNERDQSENRFGAILSGISDGFCALSRDYEVLHTNRAFRDLLKVEETADRAPLWALLSEKSHPNIKRQLDLALATGKPGMFDDSLTDDDRYFHIRAFPNRQGLFVYIQDVTDRRLLEQGREELLAEERRARSEAEQANRLKDEFVATVSHELRTPLTTILGWSEILGRKAQQHKEFADGLAAIERSTRHQAQLIEDLLDVSRLATGKLRLDLEIVDLSEIVSDAVKAARAPAAIKHIEIRTSLGPDEILIRADSIRLTQVVSNLISNALKFSPENEVVEVSITRAEGTATISVSDHGIGIDPDIMPIIFDRFRQANASITRQHGGLGLGLAIVKQITELHGGHVEAVSEGLGKGSTFRVTLPISKLMPPMMKDLPLSDHPTAVRVEGLDILVVDDDESTRNLLTVLLTDSGGVVRAASSAHEALRQIEEGPIPRIIVSDIGMPEMDGYQMMRRLRDGGVDVPSIALTAFSRQEDRDQALASGYQEHLTKPIDVDRLLATINRLTS